MIDNCDYNFGTFDDFGVKSDQKVSLNMILMSRYKGQLHGEKRAKKAHTNTHPNRAMPERIFFSYVRCSQSAPVSLPSV